MWHIQGETCSKEKSCVWSAMGTIPQEEAGEMLRGYSLDFILKAVESH